MAAEVAPTARILIIDDEPANVGVLEHLLRRAGYANLRSTTDSRQALPLYEDLQPDLILLDLRMPHVNGFELLEQFRLRAGAGIAVPVLVLTADATPEALRAALQAGARDFLTKPFDHDEVRLRVRNLLETRSLHLELQRQNRELEARVPERSQQERLARELDDQLVRMLAELSTTLGACGPLVAPEDGKHLAAADAVARELAERARGLAFDLCPALLDERGLLAALLAHFEQYTARTAVRVAFRHSGLERRLPAASGTAAYRIVQEALSNVARHGKIDRVEVGLWVDGEALMVQVADQGVGFDVAAALAHGATSGLTRMRERATLLGGWLRITSSPGESTTLTAMLPLGAADSSMTSPS